MNSEDYFKLIGKKKIDNSIDDKTLDDFTRSLTKRSRDFRDLLEDLYINDDRSKENFIIAYSSLLGGFMLELTNNEDKAIELHKEVCRLSIEMLEQSKPITGN